MSSSPVSLPPSTTKKRPIAVQGNSAAKKSRLSFELALTDQGKKLVGTPLLFPEGHAVNWKAESQQSLPSSTVSTSGSAQNGGNDLQEPIIIDLEEDVELPSHIQSSHTQGHNPPPLTLKTVPPRYRKHAKTEFNKTQTGSDHGHDVICIDISDEENSHEGGIEEEHITSHRGNSPLYGALRTDVYDDDDDDDDSSGESDSEHASSLPMPPVPSLRVDPRRHPSPQGINGSDSDFRDDESDDESTILKENQRVVARVDSPNQIGTRNNRSIASRKTVMSSGPSRARPLTRRSSSPSIGAAQLGEKVSTSSRVPAAPHSRARRVIASHSSRLLVTVSMRADVQFFDWEKRYRISSHSMPFEGPYRHVEDTCIIGDTVVVGYGDGPCQVSLIRLVKGLTPRMIDLQHGPHAIPSKTNRPVAKGATMVSCLAPAPAADTQSVRFFTGGYDKSIRWWAVGGKDAATSERLALTTTPPFAMAHRDRKLFVGVGRRLMTLDLGHLTAKPDSAATSNIIHQIHINPQAPSVSILETNHLDYQMQVFDDRRKHGFNRASDCQFGYRHEGSIASRHSRGSAHLSYFVRGYPDGCICIWDYRNSKRPVIKAKHQRAEPVVHTIFAGSEIICFGKDALTFLDYAGNVV